MDPLTVAAALSSASAIWNGIKTAVKVGKEAEGIFKQLGEWADKAGVVYDYIAQQESRPSIFKPITFEQSETKEALSIFAMKKQLQQMEREIRDSFYFGDLCHYGRDGYEEFRSIRLQVRIDRQKLIQEQLRAKKAFWENVQFGSALMFLISVLIGLMWWVIIRLK